MLLYSVTLMCNENINHKKWKILNALQWSAALLMLVICSFVICNFVIAKKLLQTVTLFGDFNALRKYKSWKIKNFECTSVICCAFDACNFSFVICNFVIAKNCFKLLLYLVTLMRYENINHEKFKLHFSDLLSFGCLYEFSNINKKLLGRLSRYRLI
jgi:hypothetical protein